MCIASPQALYGGNRWRNVLPRSSSRRCAPRSKPRLVFPPCAHWRRLGWLRVHRNRCARRAPALLTPTPESPMDLRLPRCRAARLLSQRASRPERRLASGLPRATAQCMGLARAQQSPTTTSRRYQTRPQARPRCAHLQLARCRTTASTAVPIAPPTRCSTFICGVASES